MTATALLRHFRAMARNSAWSNHRLHAACGKLPEAEYKATRVSFLSSIQDRKLRAGELRELGFES